MRIRYQLTFRHGLLFLLFVFLLSPSNRCVLAQQGRERPITSSNLGSQETAQNLTLFLSVDDPNDEVKLALEALGLPTRQQAASQGVPCTSTGRLAHGR